MKENIKLLLKGFIIGLGKIIPGVSGAMLAISLGVYEKGIKIISNIFKEFRNNYKFIIFLGTGISLSIVLGSKVILYFLSKYYLSVMLLFIGMIIGGLSPLIKKIQSEKIKLKNALLMFSILILTVLLSLLNISDGRIILFNEIIMIFFCGIIDATATIIPGISGTAILMILGYYNIITESLSNIFNINKFQNNFVILLPFFIGTLLGLIYISKLMNYLFSKHKITTYYAIMGFSISSIVLLFIQTFKCSYSFMQITVALIIMIIGIAIARKLDK